MNRVTVGTLYCPRCDRKFEFDPPKDKSEAMGVVQKHVQRAHPDMAKEFAED